MGNNLRKFYCVIANPPFSLNQWGIDVWSNDSFVRNITRVPPKGNADMAWVQHMIRAMKTDTARMAVVLPHGSLFRKGAEGRIRQFLIEQDLLEAVLMINGDLYQKKIF